MTSGEVWSAIEMGSSDHAKQWDDSFGRRRRRRRSRSGVHGMLAVGRWQLAPNVVLLKYLADTEDV
jgi:hypothetical protein